MVLIWLWLTRTFSILLSPSLLSLLLSSLSPHIPLIPSPLSTHLPLSLIPPFLSRSSSFLLLCPLSSPLSLSPSLSLSLSLPSSLPSLLFLLSLLSLLSLSPLSLLLSLSLALSLFPLSLSIYSIYSSSIYPSLYSSLIFSLISLSSSSFPPSFLLLSPPLSPLSPPAPPPSPLSTLLLPLLILFPSHFVIPSRSPLLPPFSLSLFSLLPPFIFLLLNCSTRYPPPLFSPSFLPPLFSLSLSLPLSLSSLPLPPSSLLSPFFSPLSSLLSPLPLSLFPLFSLPSSLFSAHHRLRALVPVFGAPGVKSERQPHEYTPSTLSSPVHLHPFSLSHSFFFSFFNYLSPLSSFFLSLYLSLSSFLFLSTTWCWAWASATPNRPSAHSYGLVVGVGVRVNNFNLSSPLSLIFSLSSSFFTPLPSFFLPSSHSSATLTSPSAHSYGLVLGVGPHPNLPSAHSYGLVLGVGVRLLPGGGRGPTAWCWAWASATLTSPSAHSYGLVLGVGVGMTRETANLMLGQYFKRRREFVEIIAQSGCGIGITLFSVSSRRPSQPEVSGRWTPPRGGQARALLWGRAGAGDPDEGMARQGMGARRAPRMAPRRSAVRKLSPLKRKRGTPGAPCPGPGPQQYFP
ncbi:Monocarboxylate transporter 2 [Penaeus vannamei]|uniref:Monocarboxylate transporter 2 n=1 Tax=Penaeus vannamei TaxID=6689 RepID=A0A423T308_PENVA|nr:Monocarboxylate transporter 2 [Penaeus vannamei]